MQSNILHMVLHPGLNYCVKKLGNRQARSCFNILNLGNKLDNINVKMKYAIYTCNFCAV